MAIGTFPKTGTGTTTQDAFRPDFSGIETATMKAKEIRLVSETATTITCEYDLVAKDNDDRIRAAAIDTAITALEAGTATNAQVQNLLAKVLRYLRARHTGSGETI